MDTPIYYEVERVMVLREFQQQHPRKRVHVPAWVVLTWVAALLLLVTWLVWR